MEIIAKVQGIKEIYWKGGGTREERKKVATWFANQEEMLEKLFIEEINGMMTESGIDESLRSSCSTSCIQFF